MGWIVSHKTFAEVLTPGPQNVTLFGNNVFVDVIELR